MRPSGLCPACRRRALPLARVESPCSSSSPALSQPLPRRVDLARASSRPLPPSQSGSAAWWARPRRRLPSAAPSPSTARALRPRARGESRGPRARGNCTACSRGGRCRQSPASVPGSRSRRLQPPPVIGRTRRRRNAAARLWSLDGTSVPHVGSCALNGPSPRQRCASGAARTTAPPLVRAAHREPRARRPSRRPSG